MQGQYARLAAQGDLSAQSFYGHLLLFRGQGLAARHEGARLLRLAADRGEVKAAYQLGQFHFKGDLQQPADIAQAVHWWRMAAQGGHPLAAKRLAELYRDGAEGLPADPAEASFFTEKARALGL